MAGCPVQTDTRGYVECIAKGDYEGALDHLLAANPFSSVCGRICHHPCEQNCRRAKVDAPVGLRMLKRFVVENTEEYRLSRRKRVENSREERVAIIGSGPAGLTAAHDLATQGIATVVFEKEDVPGGMLGRAIPRYRLPYNVLREDIDDILALGVELRTSCEVGKDITLEGLLKEGFSAVLIATGLSESRSLGIPGIDSDGVWLALPFLKAISLEQSPSLGKHVVVIGGGNVAFDVARCVRRLGVEEISLVSLESREEMPAWEWEIEEAEDEGIQIRNSWGPNSISAEDGRATGIELKRCTAVFDESGRFSPQFDENEILTLEADTILIAIGQWSDLTCVEGSAVKVAGGRLEYDPETLGTTQKGIFACGEVSTGPGAAVEAVGDGHRAAKAIVHYLDGGDLLRQPYSRPLALGDIPVETIEKIKQVDPVVPELQPAEERVKDFSDFERGFTEPEALAEARRCMACATGATVDEEKCAGCLTCVRVCPFGVATVDRTAVMPEDQCQTCGLCAAECPAAAIALTRFGTNRMREEVSELLSDVDKGDLSQPLIVSYCCSFGATTRETLRADREETRTTGVVKVMVPCVARLSVVDILAPFELGADGVTIISCAEDNCPYPTAEERLCGHIERAKGVLDEIGVGGDKIDHWQTETSAEESWAGFWQKSREKLQGIEAQPA
jgi:NADPH-dependent glutamate synthase beta subunit-like oxidoreductase/coenzyme F420-reducing hydrogenase delta subunit/NAD-dependent dihydropyrimidine dehydrogenase PreA subunit